MNSDIWGGGPKAFSSSSQINGKMKVSARYVLIGIRTLQAYGSKDVPGTGDCIGSLQIKGRMLSVIREDTIMEIILIIFVLFIYLFFLG